MPLGLYPRETAEALQTGFGDEDTTAPPKPSFFQGAGTAAALGVGEGAIKAGSIVGDTNIGGALAPMGVDYQQPVEESTPEEHQQNLDQTTARAVAAFAPDPHTTGAAGEILHGVASSLTRYVAGAEMAGGSPVGGMVGVGLTEGETQAAQLRAQGVDPELAKALGIGQGLMSGVGAGLPGGAGSKLITRMATGASMQATAGMLNRGMMHGALADAGYTDMAEQYKPLDGMSLLTDAVLGSAFGALHKAPSFAPSVVDAAHTAADSVHVEDAAPGAPVTPESRQAHVDNMTAAADALISGKDMPELRPVETIPNPAQDAIRTTNADAIGETAAEVAPEPTASPVEFERRADAQETARMQELRSIGLKNLDPDQMAEYAGLLDRDRLSAKVGGRRMQGVLNDDAYNEMLARGEGKPVQGFIDMDMLKSLNDQHGHGVGDEAIRTLGETLGNYFGEGNVFRRSSGGAGDEFIVQSADQVSHDSALSRARQYLDNHTLRATDAAGNIISEKRGIGFSHGSGPDIASAERAQYAEKAERKRLGLRSDRSGSDDSGAVSQEPAEGRGAGESDQATGTETNGGIADPVTREAVDAATPLLDAHPDLTVTDENGTELPAREAMQRALDDLRNATGDDELHKVAAACFGRMG